jgi:hypothetical protein
MGQLEFSKNKKLTQNLIAETFRIANSKKISRVLDQPTKYILIYDDTAFRGENINFNIFPDRLYIDSYKKIIYTDFIEFKLEYFTSLLKRIKEIFPHIHNYIVNEKIESVKIKPACTIASANSNQNRIEIEMANVQEILDFLLDPEYIMSLDIFVLAEIIRKFYMGEKDFINGFLVEKQVLKFVKALFNEKVNADLIIDKITDNPNLVDNNNFFKGNSGKFSFTVFRNQILRTPKKSAHLDSLDLKYLSTLGTMGQLLNDKRFGRRE